MVKVQANIYAANNEIKIDYTCTKTRPLLRMYINLI